MALARDLSHLPSPAKTRDDGCPPDPQPRFVHLLAERWRDEDVAESKAKDGRKGQWWFSDAGNCSRAVAYGILDVPESNPMDLAGHHATRLGRIIHDEWQQSLQARFPDAHVEVRVTMGSTGRGRVDAVVRFADGTVVLIELKSIGGFAYKMAIGERGAPQGPRHGDLAQAAINGKALGADEVVVGYIAKEAISVQAAARKRISETGRFCAEWAFSRELYEPIADDEIARLDHIHEMVNGGTLPARKYPDPELPKGHVIVDPKAGRWELADAEGNVIDTGTWWACSYCRWQDTCAKTPAGRAPVSTLVEIGATPHLEVVR